MSAMSPLARRLQLCLDATGRSKADLARACKVRPPSVSEWFSGESKSMRSDALLRAAEFFGVNALWLATGEGPQRPAQQSAAQHPAPSNLAAEPSQQWPFRNISPARWFALPTSDRQRVETFAEATLQAWEHRPTNQPYGATG